MSINELEAKVFKALTAYTLYPTEERAKEFNDLMDAYAKAKADEMVGII